MSETMVKHNKKRNAGIIYELLLREITSDVIAEGGSSEKARAIIKKFFGRGTELHKEFRLFNALVRTKASSRGVASTIVSEARDLARQIDKKKLDEEKTKLIHTINHTLDREKFYSRWIPEYRELATIQVLINEWRAGEMRNVARQAEFEESVKEWLMKERSDAREQVAIDPQVDSLVLSIMEKKFDERFRDTLTPEQKEIIRQYVLSESSGDKERLTSYLTEMKSRTLSSLSEYVKSENNQTLTEKVEMIRHDIDSLPVDNLSDESIVRYLTVSHLHATLEEDK